MLKLPHLTMWTYLWDLVDDGIETTLRELRDDLGMNSVSVATHYHTVEHIRPHTRGRPIYRADSSLYFQPDRDRWPSDALVHQVSPLLQPDAGDPSEAGDPMDRVVNVAHELGMQAVAWTICCHSSWLGERYPGAAQENALGARFPEALCPAAPGVAAFLAGMADCLSRRYGFDVIELESCHYQLGRHYHRHEKLGVTLDAVGEMLMGLCFHPATMAGAEARGVDVSALRERVASLLSDVLNGVAHGYRDLDALIADLPGLRDYLDSRVDQVQQVIGRIQAAAQPAVVTPIVWSGRDDTGVDGQAIANLTGNITICAYAAQVSGIQRAIERGVALTGDPAKLRVGYHVYPPITPSRQHLLDHIAASLDLGVQAFTFYHHGIAPRASLRWVADATSLIRNRLGA